MASAALVIVRAPSHDRSAKFSAVPAFWAIIAFPSGKAAMAEGNDDWFKTVHMLYTEQRTQLRHHELQRTAVTTFAMALTAGVATVGVNTDWARQVFPIMFL